MMADMPDDRMLATLARAGVMLFTQSTATFLVPVLIVAGAIGAGSIWWRIRRARKQGQPLPFVVIRR